MDFDYVKLNELSDFEIVEHMRKINYDKFKTLVRMHLSFELDLNTDEFDLPCHEIVYEDKGKLKKWNRVSKKHKQSGSSGTTGCAMTSKSAGNSPTEGLHQQIDPGFLFHLSEIKEFLLLEKNIIQEGIFRKTGSVSRQNELRLHIQNEKPLNLQDGDYSAHDCATVFKSYLADLPEPLLTDAHYPAHLQIAPLCIGTSFINATPSSSSSSSSSSVATRSRANAISTLTRPPNPERLKREQHLHNSMQLLLLLLPVENRQLLQHIIEMLHAIASYEHLNKMSSDNLATLFAPHLICPRNLPPEALHFIAKKMSSIIAYMINKGIEIFDIPAKLSTDIRAYFLERKRKKTMSPEQTLDDSISDISTVNTVYTFVDREKTAAAHTANTTDTELAQLYAHIQSLPESSKKRRLIKQFNKQNGQGTPLQLIVMNRIKNSEATRSAKSISDSIKKHIFHKGIMSRTPKRSTAASTELPGCSIETPNYSLTKNPKLRVLFQSPAPGGISAAAASNTVTAGTPTSSSSSISSSLSSLASPSFTNTPYTIKNHPLQKSISSSSLLLNATQSTKRNDAEQQDDIELLSSPSCVSAPVSRQTSEDLSGSSSINNVALLSNASSSLSSSVSSIASQHFHLMESNGYVTPLNIFSETAKHLAGTAASSDKKTVAWEDGNTYLQQIDEETSNPCTPLQKQSSSDLKSRYKSEPNLSRMLHKETLIDTTTMTSSLALNDEISIPHSKCVVSGVAGGRSLTRKLIKGVSMSNIKLPFSTPETTKRLVRSVSSTLKHHLSDDATNKVSYVRIKKDAAASESVIDSDVNDLDDVTFEDNPNDHVDSDSDADNDRININSHKYDNAAAATAAAVTTKDVTDAGDNSNSSSMELPGCSGASTAAVDGTRATYQPTLFQPNSFYRNLDLITSSQSLLHLGRRSMSPITKSTQRMTKAMQESIMTPRSRKPVMVLASTLSASEQNQTIYQTDLSSFREQDEDNSEMTNNASDTEVTQLHNDNSEDTTSIGSYSDLIHRKISVPEYEKSDVITNANENALTNNFKEYLLSRSVLTASPVDSSFSSQPDDFGSSTQEIDDFDESQLNSSLLYCLDGNEPDTNKNIDQNEKLNITETERANWSTDRTPTKLNINTANDHSSSSGSSNGGGGGGGGDGDGGKSQHNRLATNPFVMLNNARKRAATSDYEKITSTSSAIAYANSNLSNSNNKTKLTINKENNNMEIRGNYRSTKKLLISDYPGETSF